MRRVLCHLFSVLAGPHPRSLAPRGSQTRPRRGPQALAAVVVMMMWLGPVALGAQPPTTPAPAQEGFVPFDPQQPQEQLPAAPLVIAAYAVAWIAVLVYVWSIWQRLNRVEREIAALSRRVAGQEGGGQR